MACGSGSTTALRHNRSSSRISAAAMRLRGTRLADGPSSPMPRLPEAAPACAPAERGLEDVIMNRHLRALRLAFIAIAAMAMPGFAHAATFDADLQRESCQLRLTGAIEPGDLDRLKAKLPADFDPHIKGGPEICLNSPGGDFVEGLRIAEYVSNGLSTRVEKGAVCASACGWIFLAELSIATGDLREWTRVMDAHAQLAFHAPYIDPAGFASAAGSGQPIAFVKVINAYNQAVGE